MRRKLGLLAACVPALLVAGCSASRPVVYPNEKAQQAGPNVVQADIDECLRRAREFASGTSQQGDGARRTAERTAVGAGVGAAAGAAGGAIYGDAGRGAASGAAAGATAGLLTGIFDSMRNDDPDPVIKSFVHRCLSEKGYEVIGWE